MQSNYFSIERTIYRQLDARVLLLQRRLPTERGRAHLALWFYGPRPCLGWYPPTTEKLVITTQHMDLGQATTLLYVWTQA